MLTESGWLFLDRKMAIPIVRGDWRGPFAAPFGFLQKRLVHPDLGRSDRQAGNNMFAVIKAGGKQYRVAETDLIEVAKVAGAKGDAVAFGEVLMVGGDDAITLGSPLVSGATVAGEIVEHGRTARILVFKKRRRQNSKRSRGHRQDYTTVRITEILTDGKAPARAPAEAAAVEAPVAKPKRASTKAAATDTPEAAEKPARKPRAKAAKTDKE